MKKNKNDEQIYRVAVGPSDSFFDSIYYGNEIRNFVLDERNKWLRQKTRENFNKINKNSFLSFFFLHKIYLHFTIMNYFF